jgi:hypothetical protein
LALAACLVFLAVGDTLGCEWINHLGRQQIATTVLTEAALLVFTFFASPPPNDGSSRRSTVRLERGVEVDDRIDRLKRPGAPRRHVPETVAALSRLPGNPRIGVGLRDKRGRSIRGHP